MISPVYYIFAGINGAGKTALQRVLSTSIDFGIRISIDDTVKEMGDWRDPLLQVKAARIAMNQSLECIERRVTFHQETTLPGEAIVRFAERASENGFRVVLFYVGVDSLSIACERVKERMEAGGHGVPEELIRKRFSEIPDRLSKLIPHCDEIFFYDNTDRFVQVGMMEGGTVIDMDTKIPGWMKKLSETGVIRI